MSDQGIWRRVLPGIAIILSFGVCISLAQPVRQSPLATQPTTGDTKAQLPFTVTGDGDLVDFLSARIAQSELWTAYFTYVLQDSPSPRPLVSFDLRTIDREETWELSPFRSPPNTKLIYTFTGTRKYTHLTVYPLTPQGVVLFWHSWGLTDVDILDRATLAALARIRPGKSNPNKVGVPKNTVPVRTKDVKEMEIEFRWTLDEAAASAIGTLASSPAFTARFKPLIMDRLRSKRAGSLRATIALLPKFGEDVVPVLMGKPSNALPGDHENEVIAALGECGRLYPTCRNEVVPWLLAVVKRNKDPFKDKEQYAIEALGKCGIQALPAIVYAMNRDANTKATYTSLLTGAAWTALGRLAAGNEEKVLRTLRTFCPNLYMTDRVLPWFLEECEDPVSLAFVGIADPDPQMQEIGVRILHKTVGDWGKYLRLHPNSPSREKELRQLLNKKGSPLLRKFAAARLDQMASTSEPRRGPGPSFDKLRAALQKAGAVTSGFSLSGVILPVSHDNLVKIVGLPIDESLGGTRHYLYYRVEEGTARITVRGGPSFLVVTGRGAELVFLDHDYSHAQEDIHQLGLNNRGDLVGSYTSVNSQ